MPVDGLPGHFSGHDIMVGAQLSNHEGYRTWSLCASLHVELHRVTIENWGCSYLLYQPQGRPTACLKYTPLYVHPHTQHEFLQFNTTMSYAKYKPRVGLYYTSTKLKSLNKNVPCSLSLSLLFFSHLQLCRSWRQSHTKALLLRSSPLQEFASWARRRQSVCPVAAGPDTFWAAFGASSWRASVLLRC